MLFQDLGLGDVVVMEVTVDVCQTGRFRWLAGDDDPLVEVTVPADADGISAFTTMV